MEIMLKQFCPIVFPPGAGGHFFWELMSLHSDVMPLSTDQMMQKLFKDKSIKDAVVRIKDNNPSSFDQTQAKEKHDYYFAPPDFDIVDQNADWEIKDHKIQIKQCNEDFVNKFIKPNHIVSMVVHRQSQFPLLQQTQKQIVFDNFAQHVKASANKVAHLEWDFSQWSYDLPNCFTLEVDKFFYDWSHASVELLMLCDYLDIECFTKDQFESIKQLWNYYRSMH